jgi:hypothetical protein
LTFSHILVCALLALGCSLLFAAAHALDARRRALRERRSRLPLPVPLEPPPSREPLAFDARCEPGRACGLRFTQRMPEGRQ